MSTTNQIDLDGVAEMGKRFAAAWNRAAIVKTRLAKDRPMTSITLRLPVDVVDSMKAIAAQRGFAGYQTLLKAYLSEGLRRDEAAREGEDAAEK